jgi:hypothetical protein
LQNSLQRLRQTQDGLREYLASESPGDPEIAKALEENEVVMYVSFSPLWLELSLVLHVRCSSSQEERISILKMALTEKGVHAGSHYDLKSDSTSRQLGSAATVTANAMSSLDDESNEDEEDGGIHL